MKTRRAKRKRLVALFAIVALCAKTRLLHEMMLHSEFCWYERDDDDYMYSAGFAANSISDCIMLFHKIK